MAYKDNFSERLDIDIPDDSVALVVKIFMQEGELRFRDKLVEFLSAEVARSRQSLPDSDLHWEDGVNYVIHVLKEIDLRESE